MFRVLNSSPEPPTGRSETLPDALVETLLTALHRDPAERFADAAAFRRALKAAAPTPTAPDDDQSDDDEDATRIMRFDDTMAAVVSSGPKGELDDAAVRQASAHLASHIGPMASVIVRDAATRVSGVRQLYEVLADHIPDATERTAFMRKALRGALGLAGGTETAPSAGTGLMGTGTARPGGLGSRRGTAVGASSTGSGPGTVNGHGVRPEPGRANGPITDDHREQARRALAEHLGPIAGVLVKREAARADNPDHLGRLLAEHLPDPGDRDRFLARLRS
jgi:serine/threonine-protein kinase